MLAIETARQRLLGERHQSPTRVVGYANRLILRVEHRLRYPPDDIIQEIDPMARLLPEPPIEEGFTLGPGEKPTADPADKPDGASATPKNQAPRNDDDAATDMTGTREHDEGDAAPDDTSTPGAVS